MKRPITIFGANLSFDILKERCTETPSARRSLIWAWTLSDAENTLFIGAFVWDPMCSAWWTLPQAAVECFLEDEPYCIRKVKRHCKSLTILLFAFIPPLYRWDLKWQGQELCVWISFGTIFTYVFFCVDGGRELNCRCHCSYITSASERGGYLGGSTYKVKAVFVGEKWKAAI